MSLQTRFDTRSGSDMDALVQAPSRPLRILAVTPHFLPRIGGTEVHTHETGKRIVEAGHSFTVLTTNTEERLPERDHIDGMEVIRVPSWGNRLDLRIAPKIDAVIRSGDWELVHCQGIHTFVAPMAMQAALRAGIPYVLTFHTGGHSSRLRNGIRTAQWSMVRPLAVRANRLVGVSEFESSLFRRKLRLPAEKVTTIPNGAVLPPSGAWSPRADESETVVSIGRLERYKGHHKVLQAFPEVVRRHPRARLRIVGSGAFESNLRKMAHDLGISELVTIGPIPADDRHGMSAAISSAALVTILSDYESQGIAALEALSLKRPVLVTNSTALSELVERGLAVGLDPDSSTRRVADAIVEQLDSPFIPPDVVLPSWDDCAGALMRMYVSISEESICAS